MVGTMNFYYHTLEINIVIKISPSFGKYFEFVLKAVDALLCYDTFFTIKYATRGFIDSWGGFNWDVTTKN